VAAACDKKYHRHLGAPPRSNATARSSTSFRPRQPVQGGAHGDVGGEAPDLELAVLATTRIRAAARGFLGRRGPVRRRLATLAGDD
jgi:hypothetical protein